jgi:hypothetical protein
MAAERAETADDCLPEPGRGLMRSQCVRMRHGAKIESKNDSIHAGYALGPKPQVIESPRFDLCERNALAMRRQCSNTSTSKCTKRQGVRSGLLGPVAGGWVGWALRL